MKALRQQRGPRTQSKLLFSCPVSSLHSRVNPKRHRHFHTACTVSSEICSDICCIIKKQTEFHSLASYKIKGLVHLTLVSFQTCMNIFHAIQFLHAIPKFERMQKQSVLYISVQTWIVHLLLTLKWVKIRLNGSAMLWWNFMFYNPSRCLHNISAIYKAYLSIKHGCSRVINVTYIWPHFLPLCRRTDKLWSLSWLKALRNKNYSVSYT